ncbi:TaqI-like C-terminal specificity domain-containing protein [Paenibacillus polymyxa]|uniref:TaqI-like C-terminal specificity domain-containing protein n=1 Tax=Paenibacillus polymyxa TaxID=1406 RepID=UPI000737C41B|nr:TaqI-like C-terminal specificity domain-containing protein [Paenibacillus polymyxa]
MSVGAYKDTIKQQLGAFYTPAKLADYTAELMVEYAVSGWENDCISYSERDKYLYLIQKLLQWKVLDPACGDGSLLSSLEKAIYHKYEQLMLNSRKYKFTLENQNNKIVTYGIDIDKTAVAASKENLKEPYKYSKRSAKIIHADFLVPLGKAQDPNRAHYMSTAIFKNKKINGLIANPPWGAILNHSREKLLNDYGFTLASGQYDSYELFVERSLEIVEEGGIIALILPDSIFLPEHKSLRSLLLQNTTIKYIARLGEGFFPGVYRGCVVLILSNKTNEENNLIKVFRLNHLLREEIFNGKISLKEAEQKCAYTIAQTRFIADSEFRFDIDVKESDFEIVLKMEEGIINWATILESGRGVELSKKGNIIQCSSCHLWQPAPRTKIESVKCTHCKETFNYESARKECIVSSRPKITGHWVPFIVGEDVSRYKVQTRRYIKLGYEGINYKSPTIFSKKKILFRKTGIGINAALDSQGFTTSQTVFHFSLKDDTYNQSFMLEYLLGVLNSRVMLYYYLKKFGETEWRSHPYVTQKTITQFPIPLLQGNIRNQSYALEISSLVKEYNLSNSSVVDIEIDRLVAGLFGLSVDDCRKVLQTIEEAQQLRLISQMKLVNKNELYPRIIAE